MWWGYSEPLDLRSEIVEGEEENADVPLEVLIVGSGDARHVVKTLASAYKHRKRRVNFHVVEPFLEQVARSILLLNIVLEERLGVQEATRYHLELMGNTLLRPATAKYLVKRSQRLADIPTQSLNCPWLNLEKLKYKERDILESIFRFWGRATREGIPIVEYWDRRIRKALERRYDHREGLFDWDYHMVLRSREKTNLTLQEYKFWRRNGVAFTWLEGEPARSNPTLINDIVNYGKGYLHRAYMGDINAGPYFTWSLGSEKTKAVEKLRATDMAEREVMRAIHEIRTEEPMCDEAVAAHRDPSLSNAVIITEMPDAKIEHEIWEERFEGSEEPINWIKVADFKVIFHPISSIEKYKEKSDFIEKYHLLWIAQNMTKQLPNLVPLVKIGAKVIVESRKFIVDMREEDIHNFTKELTSLARDNGLQGNAEFDSAKDNFARFFKQKRNYDYK